MLPNALAIGVPYDLFWHLTPKKLEAFYEAHRLKQEMRDGEMWIMGRYVLSAVSVAVEHCLAGKKAKSEYLEKPFMQLTGLQNQEEEILLSEEEIQRQTEQLFLRLQIMGTNYKNNKQKGDRA
ncbi:MAG: hypothetical protein IJZ53_10760 [Tyzzerella sp.]|nr:hypothetical protein [Tyzzerella sp.]